MSSLPALDTISNGTTADATEVDGNFTIIQTYIDGELIERDGSTAMTGELTLSSSSPSGALVAASKGYVDTEIAALSLNYSKYTANHTIGTTSTSVTWDTEVVDYLGIGAAASANWTIPSDGLYRFSLEMSFTGGTNPSSLGVKVNGYGVTDGALSLLAAISPRRMVVSQDLYLQAGDIVNAVATMPSASQNADFVGIVQKLF